jgi:TIR domain
MAGSQKNNSGDMKKNLLRVFISHASSDKPFAERVATALRNNAVNPWFDKEQIRVGDDVLERLGDGLRTMDLLVLIVSKRSLRSRWVDRELKFAVRREIEERKILILPFIIDSTQSNELPWYLHHLRAEQVPSDNRGVAAILESVIAKGSRRIPKTERRPHKRPMVTKDPRVDELICNVGLGEWKKATAAALQILSYTDAAGANQVFEVLLQYQDLPDDDESFWPSLHVIEECAELNPDLMDRLTLNKMAGHPNFSVRSTAASICWRWAQFAPDRVPVDMLLTLSKYDEDWYVQAPANAALKSMAGSVPGVLEIFFLRLRGSDPEEREHAAACILDVATQEPGLLDKDDLKNAFSLLKKVKDRNALSFVRRSIAKVKGKRRRNRSKYGL